MFEIDAERLWQRLEAFSAITDPDAPWTRRAFSPWHDRGRAWLKERFAEAGLTVTIDAAGNLLGLRSGLEPELKPIMCGSHSDTVPSGGRYDGVLGVLAAVEVAQALAEQGRMLRHPLEIVDFLCEEPSDFGLSCIGSRGLVGGLDAAALALRRRDGMSLAEGLRSAGGDPEQIAANVRRPGDVAAFLELHIEQGPLLESKGIAIGIVTDIVGIRREALIVQGQADHAGTTPMTLRRDALVGAAKVIEAVFDEARRRNTQERYVVATIGRLEVSPNAANAVPGRVEMVLEVRSNVQDVLAEFPEALAERVAEALDELGLSLGRQTISSTEVTTLDPRIQRVFQEAADALGVSHCLLSSGAGHDAMWIAKIAPAGMIFVPCRQGRSHCPEESITPEQAAAGARTLGEALVRLDREWDA
jgi:N-carbamoyl-L-amino-acid hydrolase